MEQHGIFGKHPGIHGVDVYRGAQIDDELEGFDSTLRHVESGSRFLHKTHSCFLFQASFVLFLLS